MNEQERKILAKWIEETEPTIYRVHVWKLAAQYGRKGSEVTITFADTSLQGVLRQAHQFFAPAEREDDERTAA